MIDTNDDSDKGTTRADDDTNNKKSKLFMSIITDKANTMGYRK